MDHQKTPSKAGNINRQHDDWDEVHNQLLAIQKKSLEVSDPGDADEKEADEVAGKVVNGESAEINGSGSTINRKGEGAAETTPGFQSKLENNKGGGQSLDDSTRSEMESKMGADFSGVKIHTGSEAHAMNESVNAKAFTHGQDVFFRQGEFDTTSKQGKELLAHELVHTKQQEANKISRRIMVGTKETTAASLLPLVTPDVTTWYDEIVAGVTAKVPAFTAADMPFDQAGAIERAGQILTEMQDAKFFTISTVYSKRGKQKTLTGQRYDTVEKRENYDFNFADNTEVSQEVIFRLALIVNMHLANLDKTGFARYPAGNENGFNLQNSTTWSPVPTNPQGNPGGFTLNSGILPADAIIQLTTPPTDLANRIVVDCSTMMGILLYQSFAGSNEEDQQTFNENFAGNVKVGPLTSKYGSNKAEHPLIGSANPANSPYMKKVDISNLEDLVPGDTVSFANYTQYKTLAPGGLWNGEWATYTKKVDGVMYFEGFGVAENTYAYFIGEMQREYNEAWDDSNDMYKGNKLTTEKSVNTIERKLPGISRMVFRPNFNAYNQ